MLFRARFADSFIHLSPMLWCNNMGALTLACNHVFQARTKHIEVDYHFILENIVNKDVSTRYISTADQVADILTRKKKS